MPRDIVLLMADLHGLRKIAKKRQKTVEILIAAKDWDGAAYTMGLTLECALKAKICKTLKLDSYPEYTGQKKIDDYFMTHKFDLLLKVSGMENLFSATGDPTAWQNWSEFTKEYLGDWPTMRYDADRQWDETKTTDLYTNLKGVLKEIKKRW